MNITILTIGSRGDVSPSSPSVRDSRKPATR
jgi:hypothetical protein